jgi:UDP-N-acetylmuramoyl-tripeptide--D-alanyl-D-alanine ligase
LPGRFADGHDFARVALERGAAAALVGRELAGLSPLLVVDDPLLALHELTRQVRRSTPQHLVGLTGSAGKTTTKEILANLLAARYRVARSPGNLNNLLGFPLALLGIPEDTEWMVAEMGMSTPGELGGVSRLGRPDVCLFTNVGTAHLGGLGSREAIVDAKAELLEGLSPDGLVVANADNAGCRAIAARFPGRTVWFGNEQAYRIAGFEASAEGGRFELISPAGSAWISLPLLGEHNAVNFLAAATVAIELGVSPATCAEIAPTLRPVAGRGVATQLPSGARLLDESYNANPEATRVALAAARSLPGNRHLAVLGAMLELGDESESLHREVGRYAAELGFEVLAVGDEARPLAEAAAAPWLPDAEAAAAAVANRTFGPGDVILVKGSRGIGLERVVAALSGGLH